MAYRYSDIDRKILASFASDHSRKSLKSISLRKGSIRGLRNFEMEFSYPLAAIAGRNGSGKSTVLALAACAYHATARGWRAPGRKTPYYTFSDFFVQTQDEVPVEGVRIRYGLLHDNWTPTEDMPTGRGLGHQVRQKNHGGKWNDYASRLRRSVAFFGIDRVVPPSERSVLKNQKNYFSYASRKKSDVEEKARLSVSRVLGVDYTEFEIRGGGSHRLPLVERQDCKYSGFNMGAGEQALFGLFSVMHSVDASTLFVVDEIELGLHEAAQRSLVQELKKLAFEGGHQFIFTTHSAAVLESLPPEGRFFLEQTRSGTKVIEGISPAYAAGRMDSKPNVELVVYVEDVVAKQLVLAFFDNVRRRRTHVVDAGSHSALMYQAAAKFLDHSHDQVDVAFVLDGDQRATIGSHRTRFIGLVDQRKKAEASSWFEERVTCLPSDLMPERFVISRIRKKHLERFCEVFGIESEVEASAMLDKTLVRGDHSELYWLSEDLVLPKQQIWQQLCILLAQEEPDALQDVVAKVSALLSSR